MTTAFAQDAATISPETTTRPGNFATTTQPFGGGRTIDRAQPLYLNGDELIYDSKGNRVVARGNVEILYNDHVLTADKVIYDQSANTLTASGNVTLRDPSGSITRSEQITLTDDFRDGFVQSLSVVAKDETKITARRAVRRDGNVTEFESGKFTPCKHDEGKPPLWCISARRVIHDQQAATVTYLDGTFDVFGVPIAYLPYMQHPDPSVKRKSGFLIPQFASSSDLGFVTEVPYYFALSPHYDFTFHPMYTARQGMLWKGTWRQKISTGLVRGQYNVKLAGIDQDADKLPSNNPRLDGWRGSLETKGDFSLASWWKFGWDVTLESDDTFRRFYKLDNILQTDRVNSVHLTGMSEKNYFSIKGYHFGGLLLNEDENADSRAHPIADWNYVVGMPIIGGELSWNVNALAYSGDLSFTDATGTFRDTNFGENRIVADINWRRKFIDPLGITYTPFANLRGDVLNYKNAYDPIANNISGDETVTRGVASAGLLASYPWLARTSFGSHVIEPIGQIIARTGKVDQRNLPNFDSRSLVFDDTNLFEVNKISGLDRVETGTRANVGLQYTHQLDNGWHARILAGRSYHLSGENIYARDPGNEPSTSPETAAQLYSTNNGLDTDRSDYVLGLYLAPSEMFQFISQTRFDEDDFSVQRSDTGASFAYGPIAASATYTFASVDPFAADQGVSQQDILGAMSLQVSERWSLIGSLRYDIDASERRQDAIALRYADECFVLTTTYAESFIESNEKDIRPDRTIMVRFQLKHIGEFQYRTDPLDQLFGQNQG